MQAMDGTLIETVTEDKLVLQGIYSGARDVKKVVLHMHGFEGNFYENKFVGFVGRALVARKIGFLTGNTRGAEKIKVFRTSDDEYVTLGARYERLEDAYLDIDSWIEAIDKICKNKVEIVLQGHSLGTMKVVRYLKEGKYRDRVKGLILLAPFDKNAYLRKMTNKSIEELLDLAQKQIDQGRGRILFDSVPEEERMSAVTFVSWYGQDDLGRVFDFGNKGYDFAALSEIEVATLVAVSRDDEFFHPSNPSNPEEAKAIFEKYIKQVQTKLFTDGGHGFGNREEELGDLVGDFVSKL